MNFLSHKYILLTFSGALVLVSVTAFLIWGLPLGIDFTGGSLLEIEFAKSRPSSGEIRDFLAGLGFEHVIIQEVGERGMIIRSGYIDEKIHDSILTSFQEFAHDGNIVSEKRFHAIGPSLGRELRMRSFLALFAASIAIIAYIAWAFRKVSLPVASWKYGVCAVIALFHDIIIPVGVFSVFGRLYGIEIDALFVTALLTIMGFSVHDTIVVFDRIRENLHASGKAQSFELLVNQSLSEVMGRSVSTSFAVLAVLCAIFFFGGVTTRLFALALAIGIFFGTYSSLFLASPLLVVWQRITRT